MIFYKTNYLKTGTKLCYDLPNPVMISADF